MNRRTFAKKIGALTGTAFAFPLMSQALTHNPHFEKIWINENDLLIKINEKTKKIEYVAKLVYKNNKLIEPVPLYDCRKCQKEKVIKRFINSPLVQSTPNKYEVRSRITKKDGNTINLIGYIASGEKLKAS